MNESKIKVKFR